MDRYIGLYNFAMFIVMIPVIFRAFHAFDLEKFFKKGYIWQKQVVYIVFTIITAKLFADAITDLVVLMQGVIS